MGGCLGVGTCLGVCQASSAWDGRGSLERWWGAGWSNLYHLSEGGPGDRKWAGCERKFLKKDVRWDGVRRWDGRSNLLAGTCLRLGVLMNDEIYQIAICT